MTILVCGSRSIRDRQVIRDALVAAPWRAVTYLHGDAPGVDRIAGAILEFNKRAVEKMPADWTRDGRGAGFARNLRMLDRADAVIAIWDGRSPGTAHTIREAFARKLPFVVRYVWPE